MADSQEGGGLKINQSDDNKPKAKLIDESERGYTGISIVE